MTGGLVRNNVIVAGHFGGIEIIRTRNTVVCHNSVWSTNTREEAVAFFQKTENARFFNNLIHGYVHKTGDVEQAGNIIGDLTGLFVNPEIGDLRLTSAAADRLGPVDSLGLPIAPDDFAGRRRTARPTPGAFEWKPIGQDAQP